MYSKIIKLALSENQANKKIAHSLILNHFACTPKEAATEINYIIPNCMEPRTDLKLKYFGGKTSIHVNKRIETLSFLMERGEVQSDKIFTTSENDVFLIKIGDIYNSRIVKQIINLHDNIDKWTYTYKVEYVGIYTRKRILYDLSVLKEKYIKLSTTSVED